MAKITKSRSNKPLADGRMMFSSSAVSGLDRYQEFTIDIRTDEETKGGKTSFVALVMDRDDAERVREYLNTDLDARLNTNGTPMTKAATVEISPSKIELIRVAMTAAEFAYKACERGENMDMMLSRLTKTLHG